MKQELCGGVMNMRILLTAIALLWFSVFKIAWSTELNEDYHLGSGDIVKISVYEYSDITTEARLSETGNISFPLIGEVNLSGRTVAESEKLIAKGLVDGDFIRDPQVTVVITQFASQKVSVLGFVNKPGKYTLEGVSHVIDLLALANGVAMPTAANFVTLLHNDGTKVNIDLDALLAGDVTQNYVVGHNDVLFVPRAPMFYIYGEVQRPSSYKLEKKMSVTQAISMGGGLTPKGTDYWPHPIIKRRDEEGKEQEIDVEGSDLLQADDVLYLKERWF